jgi:hydrogenase maturation protease
MSPMRGPRPTRLLVCGNIERGDDGAAVTAVAGVLPRLPTGLAGVLDVRSCEQVEIEDLLDLPEAMACVVVDTVVGIPVGSVTTVALADLPVHAGIEGPSARSSHILPIGQLIAIAGILRDEPVRGVFVGLGGGSFEFGRVLGRPVLDAMPAFRRAITTALIDMSGATESP